MGMTLSMTTGYGILLPNDLNLGDRDIWDIVDSYSLIQYDMAAYCGDYWEDELHEVIFIKSTVRTEYGVGVTKLRTPPPIGGLEALEQLRHIAEELGIDPEKAEVGYWTVVSYG